MTAIEMVGTHTQREYNRQLERVYLDKFFDLIKPGEEFPSSYKAMAEKTGVPANIVSNVMQLLDKNGVLKRRFTYHGGSAKDAGGRVAYWTIITTKEHAQQLLDAYQANLNVRKPSKLPDKKSGNPVETVVEDTALSIAKKLVEECRTYMNTSKVLNETFRALESAGIMVDRETFFRSINIPHNERLEVIALVMPYIESLEKPRRKNA